MRSAPKLLVPFWTVCGILLCLSGCSLSNPFHHSVPPDNAGKILFGFGFHRVSAHELEIEKPRTTFYSGQTIAWVAYLNRPANSLSLTISIRSARTHKLIVTKPVRISNPKFTELADSQPVKAFPFLHVAPRGTYILRYTRGSVVLAEGVFRLRR